MLRGPQGTLWGAQAIGGLIYFRSNRPDPAGLDAQVQGDVYGTSGDSGTSSRMSGYVNVPLAEDGFAVRLAAQRIDEAGYIENVRTGTEGINDVEETAWRLSALYQPTDTLSVTAIWPGNDLDADAPTYFDISLGGLQVDQPSDAGPAEQNYDLFNLIVDYDLGWATVSYNGSRYTTDGNYTDFNDELGFLQQVTTSIDEKATGNVTVPSQNVVNFSAGANWDTWQLKLYVDNVTDKAPWLNVFSGGAVGTPEAGQAVRANTIRPRTVGLEATYRFGH